MYKLCKTEQSARRQREIENSLLDLMRVRRFEDITVTELCEYVGMPRKAFYRYFDSKEDTLYALIDHTLGEYTGFEKTASELSHRNLQTEIAEYFAFWKEKKALLDVLMRNALIGILIDHSIAFPVADRVDMGKFQKGRDKFTKDIVMKFAFSGLVFVMLDWYRAGFRTSVQDIASVVCDVFTKPLFPNLGDFGFML